MFVFSFFRRAIKLGSLLKISAFQCGFFFRRREAKSLKFTFVAFWYSLFRRRICLFIVSLRLRLNVVRSMIRWSFVISCLWLCSVKLRLFVSVILQVFESVILLISVCSFIFGRIIIGRMVSTFFSVLQISIQLKILKLVLFIFGYKRVARFFICSYRMRLRILRRNTILQIDGISTSVVSRSTVITILGSRFLLKRVIMVCILRAFLSVLSVILMIASCFSCGYFFLNAVRSFFIIISVWVLVTQKISVFCDSVGLR